MKKEREIRKEKERMVESFKEEKGTWEGLEKFVYRR